jgi:hypothetical protein
VAAGTGDPEGSFTPVNLGTAVPGPPTAAMGLLSGRAARPMGSLGICGPAVAGGVKDPEGAFYLGLPLGRLAGAAAGSGWT